MIHLTTSDFSRISLNHKKKVDAKNNATDESDCKESVDILKTNTSGEPSNQHVGRHSWCQCGFYCSENRETDCVCCQEILAITKQQFSDNNNNSIWKFILKFHDYTFCILTFLISRTRLHNFSRKI